MHRTTKICVCFDHSRNDKELLPIDPCALKIRFEVFFSISVLRGNQCVRHAVLHFHVRNILPAFDWLIDVFWIFGRLRIPIRFDWRIAVFDDVLTMTDVRMILNISGSRGVERCPNSVCHLGESRLPIVTHSVPDPLFTTRFMIEPSMFYNDVETIVRR